MSEPPDAKHTKTRFGKNERVIYFGPRAQDILWPFLMDRLITAYVLSPAEAKAERRAAPHAARKTPLSCRDRPGANRKARPTHNPGECYAMSLPNL